MRPCFLKQTKEATGSRVPVLLISPVMMTLITPMHPTKFNSNLTFFSPPPAAAVSMTTRAPAATLKHDQHKRQKMDLIDLGSPHRTHMKAECGV